jgi:hypothetical protein
MLDITESGKVILGSENYFKVIKSDLPGLVGWGTILFMDYA